MNLFDNVEFKELAPIAARTTTLTGSAFKVSALAGIGALVLQSAAGTGTTPTLDAKIQHSDDGSTGWTDVAGLAFTQVTDGGTAYEAVRFKPDAVKPFIRAVGTIAGSTPSFTFGVSLVSPKQYSDETVVYS